jgi:hypothetical protein
MRDTTDPSWQLFIYRLPPTPSRARVAVWRELRRLGALPLQQAVAVVPELGDLGAALDGIEQRVLSEGGSVYRFALSDLSAAQQARLRAEWNALRAQEFAEIVEECETKFTREVEFELFRNNLTAGEAEEIEADLEKIRTWFARVAARDWFGAPNRPEAEAAIEACARLLDDFVERVYVLEATAGPSLEPPAQLAWEELPRVADGLAADTPETPEGAADNQTTA